MPKFIGAESIVQEICVDVPEQTVGPITIEKGKTTHFMVNIPESCGSISVRTFSKYDDPTAKYGDIDVWLRSKEKASSHHNDAKSDVAGTNKSVELIKPVAGNMYIAIHANKDECSNLFMEVKYVVVSAKDILPELKNGELTDKLSAKKDTYLTYSLNIPPYTRDVMLQLAGTEKAKIYMGLDEEPTFEKHEYESFDFDKLQTILITNPTPGKYFVKLYAVKSFSGAKIDITFNVGVGVYAGEKAKAGKHVGLYSAIDIPDTGIATKITVKYVLHNRLGVKLETSLIDPSGNKYMLSDNISEFATDVTGNYEIIVPGVEVKGIWKLFVLEWAVGGKERDTVLDIIKTFEVEVE